MNSFRTREVSLGTVSYTHLDVYKRQQYDWRGWVPFEDLPTSYDPPEGYLVAANQACLLYTSRCV